MKNKIKPLWFLTALVFWVNQVNSQSKLVDRLDHYMTNASYFGFSGGLLVEKDGKLVLSKGYGFANKEYLVPFTDSTMIDIASCTKPFTATAILQLHDEGKLDVKDKITKYFDNVPKDKVNITIGQLLSNSSGLGEYMFTESNILRENHISKVLQSPLEGNPNQWYYSNEGFNVLAAIVEIASGMPYETYIKTHFIEPLKMTHTGFFGDKKWPQKYIGHSYNRERDYGAFSNNPNKWSDKGSGNIASSIQDIYKFVKGSMQNDFLKESTYQKQFKKYVDLNSKWGYGYGWFLLKSERNTKVWRFGGNNTPAGITIEVRIFPEENALYILFCNQMIDDIGLVRPIRDEIEKMMFNPNYENQLTKMDTDLGNAGQLIQKISFKSKTKIESYLNQYILYTENQDVVNAITQPDEERKAVLKTLNDKTEELFDQLLNGKYADKEVQDYYWDTIKLKDYKVLCTVPLSEDNSGTFVRTWTPMGEFVFICVWEGKELSYINDETNGLPSWRLVKTKTGFSGYDLILNKKFEVKITNEQMTVESANHQDTFDI